MLPKDSPNLITKLGISSKMIYRTPNRVFVIWVHIDWMYMLTKLACPTVGHIYWWEVSYMQKSIECEFWRLLNWFLWLIGSIINMFQTKRANAKRWYWSWLYMYCCPWDGTWKKGPLHDKRCKWQNVIQLKNSLKDEFRLSIHMNSNTNDKCWMPFN